MARVLVTGGTGVLGRELVPRLGKAGNIVRVMSRRAGESNAAGDVEWADYAPVQEYAGVCFWAIRKLEYSFAAEAIGALAKATPDTNAILHLTC